MAATLDVMTTRRTDALHKIHRLDGRGRRKIPDAPVLLNRLEDARRAAHSGVDELMWSLRVQIEWASSVLNNFNSFHSLIEGPWLHGHLSEGSTLKTGVLLTAVISSTTFTSNLLPWEENILRRCSPFDADRTVPMTE